MVAWDKPLPWVEDCKDVVMREMRLDGFVAKIMFAERLEGKSTHGLPPGRAAEVVQVDCLPGVPESWVRGRGSYVVPVETGTGIWFDWRNGAERDMNTAVVPSVKGMNPLTGMPLDGMYLESYVEKCPKHGTRFKGGGRFCEECGWEWPPQGYITYESTMWWDGFRQPDGTVRQFFFTDEDRRDIASALIGKENTVPAFGFAFYCPKNPRTPPPRMTRGVGWKKSFVPHEVNYVGSSVKYSHRQPDVYSQTVDMGVASFTAQSLAGAQDSDLVRTSSISCSTNEKRSASVSIGAGAKIRQGLMVDSLGLEGWQERPSAVIRLYFCFEEEFRKIVKKGGIKEFNCSSEGMLEGLPVG